MEANELNIATFLEVSKTRFVIPVYQRNYSWKEANCKQLLKDMAKMNHEHTHFIGSIVYLKDKDQDFKGREFLIIDGQQRLTTITIALISLYQLLKKMDNYRHKDIEEDYLVNKNNADNSKSLKLITNEENSVVLDYLFNGIEENKPPANLDLNQVYINYMYFHKYFTDKTEDELVNLLDKFLKLNVVSIALEKNKDDPQKIFESLNSTGVNLTKSDLIRNFILMDLERDKQDEIYNIWKQIEENTTFINDKNKLEVKTSDFIRDFITFKTKIIPIKDQVYDDYKKKYESKIKDYDNLKNHMLELKKFSEYYKSLLQSKHEDKDIQEQIMYINKLKIGVSYPFIFTVLDNYERDLLSKEYVIRIFDLIQSFVWRRSIVDASTNALNKIFSTLHNQIILEGASPDQYIEFITKGLLKNYHFPTDEKIKEALKNKNIYKKKSNNTYFFLKLERHNNKEIVKIDNLDIEHIFPQKAETNWKSDLSDQDYSFLENRLHTLANLTLVATNSSLGNKNFIEKRDLNTNNKQQGYKFSKLWLNSKLKTYEKWTQEEYEDRFNDLYNRFLEIWEFPYDYYKSTDGQKIFTLADQMTFTHTDIQHAKYNNSVTEFDHYSDLYKHVIKQIFLEYKDKIITNEELLNAMKITTESNKLTDEFIDGYYIHTATSTQEKIRQLRYLFRMLNIPLTALEITIKS